MIAHRLWQFKDMHQPSAAARQIMPADTCGPATEMGQRKPYDIVHKFFSAHFLRAWSCALAHDLRISSSFALCRRKSASAAARWRLPIFFTQVPDL